MPHRAVDTVIVRIVAVDPPFDVDHGVLFGLQGSTSVDDAVLASGTAVFEFDVDVIRSDGSAIDFGGIHVHGRKGDRFVYLCWGVRDSSREFVMFARAKIMLSSIPPDVLELAVQRSHVVVCELDATNDKGEPASGTIRPPAMTWDHAPRDNDPARD